MDGMKVGLLGLGRGGRQVAAALLKSSWCRLVAVASPHANRLAQWREEHPDIAAYSDCRSCIVENSLDALFVALPPHVRPSFLALAAERRVPVFVLAPPARRLEEAAELLQRFEKTECPVVVARVWGSEPALQPDAMSQLGRVFLARGSVMTCWSGEFDWRGDSVRAGGGALLHTAYGMVDAAVQAMGVPGTVYATASGASRPERRLPYDTEDTAGVTCSFNNGGVGVFGACWTCGPDQWRLELSGTDGAVDIDQQRVLYRDRAGAATFPAQARAANPLQPQIDDFLSTLQFNARGVRSTLRQHLPTMAVFDAMYLSTRTGQPEHPGRLADMHDI